MPCVDCAGVRIEINALKDFMSQWFEIILKKVEKNADILHTLAPEYHDENIGENCQVLDEQELLRQNQRNERFNHDDQNSTDIPPTTVFAVAKAELFSQQLQSGSFKKSVHSSRRKISKKLHQDQLNSSSKEYSSPCQEFPVSNSTDGEDYSSFPAIETESSQSAVGYQHEEEDSQYLAENVVKSEVLEEYVEDAEMPSTSATVPIEEQHGGPRKRLRRDTGEMSKMAYNVYPHRSTIRCRLCGVAVMNETANKNSHSKTHLDIRPFRCGRCTFSAKKRGDIYRHLRTVHAGEEPPLVSRGGCNLDILVTVDLEEYHRIMKVKLNECFG